MKAGVLVSGIGALVYITSHDDFMDEALATKLDERGITKFLAFEVSAEEVKARYGGHYSKVLGDLREKDDLRIVDFEGSRAFSMFSFEEMGAPYYHERK